MSTVRILSLLLLLVLGACSKQHTGPAPELFLKCTNQERPMGPYRSVYAKENGWEMYKAESKWTPDGSYQQIKGEFCEIISE